MRLKLEAPERSVGLDEFEADVPSLVVAPDDLSLGFSAGFRVHQADASMKRKRCAHDGHATRMADVYGDRIGGLMSRVLVPFDEKLHFGKDAFVTA